EFQFARLLEPLDQRMLELELADEAKTLGEAVVEEEHEAVEIEERVFVLGLVEVEVHVARDGPGLRARSRVVAAYLRRTDRRRRGLFGLRRLFRGAVVRLRGFFSWRCGRCDWRLGQQRAGAQKGQRD